MVSNNRIFFIQLLAIISILAGIKVLTVYTTNDNVIDGSPLAVKILSDRGMGTAFNYRGYLITAAHVCQDSVHLDIIIHDHAENTTVLYVDPRADICIMRPVIDMPQELDRGVALDDDTITQIGFAGYDLVESTQTLKRATDKPSSIGIFNVAMKPQPIYVHAYKVLTGVSLPGMSGGPALNSNGELVGLLTGGDSEGRTLIADTFELDTVIHSLNSL